MSEVEDDHLESYRDSFEEKYLQEYLERTAKILKISNPKFSISSCVKKGENFVGIVHRVLIEGKNNNVPKKIFTVFKIPPKDEKIRQLMQIPFLFSREHVFYMEIVPIFEDLLKARNKTLENIPKCYFSIIDNEKEAICLEDLKPKGFVMRDRMKQLDFAHASLAFRALGRFHALSFALRDQRPEIFSSKIQSLKEPLFRAEVVNNPFFDSRLQDIGELVKMALSDEDSKYTERFSKYLKDAASHLGNCTAKLTEPYAVLGHGDFWMNNMLFKYNEDSTEPEDIYLLDFQIARYSSPVIDICYNIFCCCSKELRDRHFDDLLKIYHKSLSNYLLELGSDPEKLFPYDALMDQLERFSINAVGLVLLVLHLMTGNNKEMTDLDTENGDIPALKERFKRDHFWRNTLKDSFKDMIDKNLI